MKLNPGITAPSISQARELSLTPITERRIRKAERHLSRVDPVKNTRIRVNLLSRVGEVWRPYRSVASWYLWRSLEGSR